LQSLPQGSDYHSIKKKYFPNEHLVAAEPEINILTGKCTGRAKVKVRCQTKLKSDGLLKKLYKKGANVQTAISYNEVLQKPTVELNKPRIKKKEI